MERAQAARALPFPLGRKRKQKGPFCTALRQQKDGDTLKAVRRDAQKLAASRRSNNLCARFFTARGAMKKSPHEPRSQILRVLPRPPDSAQWRIKMPVTKPIRNHAFYALFSSLRLDRQAAFYADSHYVSFERSCIVPLGKIRRTVVPFPSIENREIPSPILSHSRLLR